MKKLLSVFLSILLVFSFLASNDCRQIFEIDIISTLSAAQISGQITEEQDLLVGKVPQTNRKFIPLLWNLALMGLKNTFVNGSRMFVWLFKLFFLRSIPSFWDWLTDSKNQKIQKLTMELVDLKKNFTDLQIKSEKNLENKNVCEENYLEFSKGFAKCLKNEDCRKTMAEYITFNESLLKKIVKQELNE